ncbi:putative protein isoform X2 [Capsicum galapagoense]
MNEDSQFKLTPPDKKTSQMAIDNNNKTSYRDMVRGNITISSDYSFQCHTSAQQEEPTMTKGFISLSIEDRQRIYGPWHFMVIIRAVRRRFNHQYLKTKLTGLWIRFRAPIWIRLPQMPTEFYDVGIVERIGRTLEAFVKIDTCTSSTLRGCYARICVQIPLKTTLMTSVMIGSNTQQIQYEGEAFLCKVCRCLGHTSSVCKIRPSPAITTNPSASAKQHASLTKPAQEWQTVQVKHVGESSYMP